MSVSETSAEILKMLQVERIEEQVKMVASPRNQKNPLDQPLRQVWRVFHGPRGTIASVRRAACDVARLYSCRLPCGRISPAQVSDPQASPADGVSARAPKACAPMPARAR